MLIIELESSKQYRINGRMSSKSSRYFLLHTSCAHFETFRLSPDSVGTECHQILPDVQLLGHFRGSPRSCTSVSCSEEVSEWDKDKSLSRWSRTARVRRVEEFDGHFLQLRIWRTWQESCSWIWRWAENIWETKSLDIVQICDVEARNRERDQTRRSSKFGSQSVRRMIPSRWNLITPSFREQHVVLPRGICRSSSWQLPTPNEQAASFCWVL